MKTITAKFRKGDLRAISFATYGLLNLCDNIGPVTAWHGPTGLQAVEIHTEAALVENLSSVARSMGAFAVTVR